MSARIEKNESNSIYRDALVEDICRRIPSRILAERVNRRQPTLTTKEDVIAFGCDLIARSTKRLRKNAKFETTLTKEFLLFVNKTYDYNYSSMRSSPHWRTSVAMTIFNRRVILDALTYRKSRKARLSNEVRS